MAHDLKEQFEMETSGNPREWPPKQPHTISDDQVRRNFLRSRGDVGADRHRK